MIRVPGSFSAVVLWNRAGVAGHARPSTRGARGADSVTVVLRQCSRPGCAEPAAATLTYVYARQAATLDDLSVERDPHGYDLCGRHAARVRVPNGWQLHDGRSRLLARLAG
jgi:Protein of unknown function (DUF3499)